MTTKHAPTPTKRTTRRIPRPEPATKRTLAKDAQWLTAVSMHAMASALGRIADLFEEALFEEATQRERKWAQRRAKHHIRRSKAQKLALAKRSKAQKNAIATARAVRAMKRGATT